MGTNFYAKRNACTACGRGVPKHVGQRAGDMALSVLRAKRDARNAAEWRKKAGLA